MSILTLITQGIPAPAKMSDDAAISSQQVITTEATAATALSSASTAESSVISVPEAIPVSTSPIVQSVPFACHLNQMVVTGDCEDKATFSSLLTPTAASTSETPPLSLEADNNSTNSDDPMAQVTPVSQLSNVRPSDWDFSALKSLIARYGVIADYLKGIYQDKAITRYEFAAGLQAVLERVSELRAARLEDLISHEDLLTLQRLQSDFAAELVTLRGRVDNLQARTAELQTNQFSPTTKLQGQVVAAVSAGGFNGKRIIDPTGAVITNRQPNATVPFRASLDFNTSFTGTDLLKLRLDTVSDHGTDNTAGFLEPNLGSVFEYTVRGTPDRQLGIDRLYYSFTPTKDLNLTLGPTIVVTDFVDLNSYANGNGIDFSTLALVNNYILLPVNGDAAGAVLQWNPGQGPFKLRALYAAADGANPNSNNQTIGSVFALSRLLYPNGGGRRGLFGSPYQGTVELEYSPSRVLALRLDYSGGKLFNGRFDVLGANLELALSQHLAIFGRYGYGGYSRTAFGNINPNYWMAGVSVRDLIVPGAFAGVAVGQPFIDNALGNATQTNIEGFYSFPINDNIKVTPVLQVIAHAANQNSNGTIITGSVRTVFSF